MNSRKDREIIRVALDTTLSGLQDDPWLARKVLDDAKGEVKVKKKLSLGLILILTLVLVAITAFAVTHSYVLEYLFGTNSEVKETYEASVQGLNIIHKGNEVTTTIKDALVIDDTVSFGLSFEASGQMYIVTDSVTVNGIDCEVNTSSLESQWVGNNPNGEIVSPLIVHGYTVSIPAEVSLTESICVRLRLKLLKPAISTCFINTDSENKLVMWKEIDRAVSEGNTPIDLYEPYYVLVSSAWLGEEFSDNEEAQYPLNSATALINYSNMILVDEVDETLLLQNK